VVIAFVGDLVKTDLKVDPISASESLESSVIDPSLRDAVSSPQSLASMTISQRVIDILVCVTEADELRTESELRLFDRGYLDSLGAVELLLQLSTEFGITLSPTEIDRELWATPSRIVRFMQHRIGE
jgi:D-alanine--poly(phosphoribitol) ligase subunit 2